MNCDFPIRMVTYKNVKEGAKKMSLLEVFFNSLTHEVTVCVHSDCHQRH